MIEIFSPTHREYGQLFYNISWRKLMKKAVAPVSVLYGLLIEAPKAMFWTFPKAFIIAITFGYFAPIPLIFGLKFELNIDL